MIPKEKNVTNYLGPVAVRGMFLRTSVETDKRPRLTLGVANKDNKYFFFA